jgi:hypothetical protein
MGPVVMGDVRHTKKARRKQWKRKKRTLRAMGLDPNEHKKPLNQQLWFKRLLKVTEFDVVRARQDGLLSFPRFFAFQRPGVMQPYPLSAEPQASLA